MNPKFTVGELVYLKIAVFGFPAELQSDLICDSHKVIWLDRNEYLIGQVVEAKLNTEIPKSYYTFKILTAAGVVHLFEQEIRADCYTVDGLTPEKAEWIAYHCNWNSVTGKHTLLTIL